MLARPFADSGPASRLCLFHCFQQPGWKFRLLHVPSGPGKNEVENQGEPIAVSTSRLLSCGELCPFGPAEPLLCCLAFLVWL